MADANGNIIPLTEDDQGEGVKDFFIIDEAVALTEREEEVFNSILEEGKKNLGITGGN